MQHTPLDVAQLSPEAQRAVAPGPARMMAARGLAPISKPSDLATVLYQLSVDSDATVAGAATKSATEVPDNLLEAAFGDPQLDPRVLDYYATIAAKGRPPLLTRIAMNPAVADETVATLAARADAGLVDIIAQNEERLLRCPAIIGAMYNNRRARMSVVDRAVELAIRNEIKVAEIPAWEELVQAVMQSGKRKSAEVDPTAADAAFERAAAAAQGGEIVEVDGTEEEVPLSQLSVPQKIRLAMIGDMNTRSQLIRDPARMVAMAAIKAPGVKETEVLKHASNSALHEDVISYIARQREWTKDYRLKSALVKNPKTPVALSIRLIPHMREKDLQVLAKSKNVPSALSAKARKLVMARRGTRR